MNERHRHEKAALIVFTVLVGLIFILANSQVSETGSRITTGALASPVDPAWALLWLLTLVLLIPTELLIRKK